MEPRRYSVYSFIAFRRSYGRHSRQYNLGCAVGRRSYWNPKSSKKLIPLERRILLCGRRRESQEDPASVKRQEKRRELARSPGKVLVVASALTLDLLVLRRGVRRPGILREVFFPYTVTVSQASRTSRLTRRQTLAHRGTP